jgi:hypothetical protein
MPLSSVAIGRLWKAEKFSILIQDGQPVVTPHGILRSSSLRAAASSSGQVAGALSVSSPASRNWSLF